MLASENKTSEIPFHSSIKTEASKPEEKSPRKSKSSRRPLTVAGMTWGTGSGGMGEDVYADVRI